MQLFYFLFWSKELAWNTIFIDTRSWLLPPPKLEDGQIEDWNGEKHSPSGQVVHGSEGVPQGSLELHPGMNGIGIEIRWIVSRGVKNITTKTKCQMQNAPPEIFLLANTEKIAVSEIDIEDYGDAEGQADQKKGGHQ